MRLIIGTAIRFHLWNMATAMHLPMISSKGGLPLGSSPKPLDVEFRGEGFEGLQAVNSGKVRGRLCLYGLGYPSDGRAHYQGDPVREDRHGHDGSLSGHWPHRKPLVP